MAELTSILTRVARWLALKRREGVSVAASVFHDYLLEIDAPDDTVERCESMGWITYEPRRGYSSSKSDFSGNIYLGPIRWTEAIYVIGAGIGGTTSASLGPRVEVDTPVGDSHSITKPDGQQHQSELLPFQGGTLEFFEDRVELCGVDICSGPRSKSRRVVLELLSKRLNNASFAAYSGCELENMAKRNGAKGTAARWIRDLRDDIMESLRSQANIVSGDKDVILSGGRGYRFAECLTVQRVDQPWITDITDMDEESDVRNDDVRNVLEVPDDEAARRRAWIVEQLADGVQLKAPLVAAHFKRSKKTAQRDLDVLRDQRKIEFVGDPRTGYYRIRRRSNSRG